MLSEWTINERLGFPKMCPGKAVFCLNEIHKVAKKSEEYKFSYPLSVF